VSDEVQRERELAEAWRKAEERADKAEADLAAMTQNRDELRQALNRVARERDSAEEERNHAQERAWRAESSLTIRHSLCRDIAAELGCEGLEGDESLKAGLAMIRALKQARDAAYHRLRKESLR
jgi:chromosome segregation ATPase